MERLIGVYLIAREYLEGFDTARDRVYDREQWVAVLLAVHSAEEYLCQLAALNHAANSDELTLACRDRFLEMLADDAAEAVRSAMAGGVDGRPQWLLARQMILRAMQVVLVTPKPTMAPDPRLLADLEGIDCGTAAIVLVHLAADSHRQDRGDSEPLLAGMAESLAMGIIANNVFNDRDDDGDMLCGYRLLWKDVGGSLTQVTLRHPPVNLLEEATGIDLEDLTALAYGYWAHARMRGFGTSIKLKATIMPGIHRQSPRAAVSLAAAIIRIATAVSALSRCGFSVISYTRPALSWTPSAARTAEQQAERRRQCRTAIDLPSRAVGSIADSPEPGTLTLCNVLPSRCSDPIDGSPKNARCCGARLSA